MNVDGWIDLKQQQPATAQRCMVWHPRYDRPVFAYFFSRPHWEQGEFYESVDGENCPIRFARWWKPEPSRPEGVLFLDPKAPPLPT